ncbi:MAG: hypothetical protein ACRELD_16995, partial [Longimicrobiales bacterium]
PTTVAPADPAHPGPSDAGAVRGRDHPREPLLNVPAQRHVRGEPHVNRDAALAAVWEIDEMLEQANAIAA